MEIKGFIQNQVLLPRLKKNGVLVVYDPDVHYLDLCLGGGMKLRHDNSESKSYLKPLSEAKGDFSEETIRKFSAAFEQTGV